MRQVKTQVFLDFTPAGHMNGRISLQPFRTKYLLIHFYLNIWVTAVSIRLNIAVAA
jgi:hypothetical protein